MNNDSAPTSAPAPPPTSSPPSAVNDHQPNDNPAGDAEQSAQQPQLSHTPAQLRAQAQTKKKYEFVNALMTNLDVIIYAELCILYYME